MRAADINALVTSYAAWRSMVVALPIGVFNAAVVVAISCVVERLRLPRLFKQAHV